MVCYRQPVFRSLAKLFTLSNQRNVLDDDRAGCADHVFGVACDSGGVAVGDGATRPAVPDDDLWLWFRHAARVSHVTLCAQALASK